jgi:hypothetical protein
MPPLQLPWNPFDFADPGPRMQVVVMHTEDEMKLGIGLDYPEPLPVFALLDTGAQTTIINRVLAINRKLTMTNARVRVSGVGGPCLCDEYACSVSFPGSGLPAIGAMKILAGDFERGPYSGLIGRDIIRFWKVMFDGRSHCVSISN